MTVEPYASTKDKRMFKPVQKHLVAEVERREQLLNPVPVVEVNNNATGTETVESVTATPRRNITTEGEGGGTSSINKSKKEEEKEDPT